MIITIIGIFGFNFNETREIDVQNKKLATNWMRIEKNRPRNIPVASRITTS